MNFASGFRDLFKHLEYLPRNGRRPPYLVGIAGEPGAGAATLAWRYAEDRKKLLTFVQTNAVVCSMSGFLLSDERLEAKGMLTRKGQIETYDGEAFAAAVARLRDREAFWWPSYSSELNAPVEKGIHINGDELYYIVEGTYLLANQEPWLQTAAAMDIRVFAEISDVGLTNRLRRQYKKGWRNYCEILEWIETVDLPNAKVARSGMKQADILFHGMTSQPRWELEYSVDVGT